MVHLGTCDADRVVRSFRVEHVQKTVGIFCLSYKLFTCGAENMSAALLGGVVVAFLVTTTSGLVPRVHLGAEPNPPVWPSNVRVFGPSDTDIEEVVNTA